MYCRSKNFRGKISLTGGHVNDTGNSNKPNSFEFHVKDGDAEILVLAASTPEEKEKWLSALSSTTHNEVTKEVVPGKFKTDFKLFYKHFVIFVVV